VSFKEGWMSALSEQITAQSAPPDRPRAPRMQFALGISVVAVAVALALATYLILTGQTRFVPDENLVVALLGANAALVLAMMAMIAWQLMSIWRGRERGIAGARLHVRLITMFGLVAALPAVLVAIFASVTLDRGLDAWFSTRTRAIIDNAQTVAEAYLLEHGQNIRGDAAAMRNDVNRARELYMADKNRFGQLFTSQAALRSLSAVYMIQRDGDIILSAVSRRDEVRYLEPPEDAFIQAKDDRVVVFSPGIDNIVRALTKLPEFEDAYLYVSRSVDPRVVQHLREIQESRAEYNALEGRRTDVQITFALLYIGLTLIFLLAAIWSGIWVANRLVQPIGRLITAARRVSEGDLGATVEISRHESDLAALGRTFNDMTRRLSSQRDELITANAQLDSRRRFTEAVLSGVTSGVIGLDAAGRIELANRAASELIGRKPGELVGRPLATLVPEFAPSLGDAVARYPRRVDAEVNMVRKGAERNLHLRVTSEQSRGEERGYVVTFDDVTELVTAQRSSAWADIARRIAHEIKNPLTPIQLSAERLRRKYAASIETDRDIFEQCTSTIIRQVGDIGRMVDEFSSFARMPKANMEPNDIYKIVREAVVLQRVGRPELEFNCQVPDEPLVTMCDRRLIGQALTNLVKNASEAIEVVADRGEDWRGRIAVSARAREEAVVIEVVDNGCGLPKQGRHRLIEPYMTTREKGTGLGLAIVRKIVDEHGGSLTLEDAPEVASGGHGALVRLEIPVRTEIAAPIANDQISSRTESTRDGV
jgi:two-component system nitrogen regulation sensor histidine kinase NtrY